MAKDPTEDRSASDSPTRGSADAENEAARRGAVENEADAKSRVERKAKAKSSAKRKKQDRESDIDLHTLYEASVQNVDADVDFIERIWKKKHEDRPHWLREDFCGSASLAAHFATRHPDNRALGVDLDGATLEWGRRHRVERLADAASRITLVERDVRHSAENDLEVVTAFNFSYWVFRTREELRAYFSSVHDSLRVGGLFFLDVFGGTAAMDTVEEETRHPRQEDPYGVRIPAFSYIWDQASFNPIDHEFVCHIHFEVGRGRRRKMLRRAFSYTWRFWTLPELRELLAEAGFSGSEVYVEGWDEEADEPDGIFRLKKRFDNEGSWIAYLVAAK